MRLDHLLTTRNITLYGLAKAVEKRGVSEQAVYRLARVNGAPQRLDMRLLAALHDVLKITDMNELLARGAPPPPSRKPAVRQRDRKPARR